jgi:transposase
VPALPAAGRHDLGDDEWSVLEPLLPAGRKAGRPPKWARRQLIDGIRWRIRAGAPWRDVPPCYGPWQSVYGLFRRWQRDGTWRKILTALQALADAAGHVTWDVSVDSGTARAHQHAAGARKDGTAQKEPPGGDGALEPADHARGRSRLGRLCPGRVGSCPGWVGGWVRAGTCCRRRGDGGGRCSGRPWGAARHRRRMGTGRRRRGSGRACCVRW